MAFADRTLALRIHVEEGRFAGDERERERGDKKGFATRAGRVSERARKGEVKVRGRKVRCEQRSGMTTAQGAETQRVAVVGDVVVIAIMGPGQSAIVVVYGCIEQSIDTIDGRRKKKVGKHRGNNELGTWARGIWERGAGRC